MANLEKAITDLLGRLESVTKRLEGVEKQLAAGGGSHAPAAPAAASAGADLVDSPFVAEFDDLVNQHVKPFVELSKKVNDLVHQQAQLFEKAVQAERDLLVRAANCKKPSPNDIQKIIEPISKLLGDISNLREKNRAHANFNHLSTISEGVGALGWVVVSPTPGPHVNEARAQSEFWSNRILKDFKGKDQTHVDWVTHFNTFLKDLVPYIKKYHTTELTWNPRGGDPLTFQGAAGGPPPAPKGPPPPPAGGPPPPPPPPAQTASSGKAAPDTGALFAALNRGGDVTVGLKKVTDDMKNWKKPEKVSSVVPADAIKEKKAPTKAGAKQEEQKPPVLKLDGNKWIVSHQINNKEIILTETEPRQTVYIFKCEGSVVQVKGKVNNVTLDGCKKTAVVFESVISAVEIVNSASCEIQCSGRSPSFAIDKTSGVQIYITSKEGLDTEIVQSKSSEMNVLIPGANPGDDLVELPIPEQFKTHIKGNKLVTEPVSHV